MNRIFNIVYSAIRHTYIVCSELAKGKTKSKSRASHEDLFSQSALLSLKELNPPSHQLKNLTKTLLAISMLAYLTGAEAEVWNGTNQVILDTSNDMTLVTGNDMISVGGDNVGMRLGQAMKLFYTEAQYGIAHPSSLNVAGNNARNKAESLAKMLAKALGTDVNSALNAYLERQTSAVALAEFYNKLVPEYNALSEDSIKAESIDANYINANTEPKGPVSSVNVTSSYMNNSIMIGREVAVAQGGVVAIGNRATGTGYMSVALGGQSISFGEKSLALGGLSMAMANYATAVGAHSYVDSKADGGTAIGIEANVFAANGLAVGNTSESTAAYSSAFGNDAHAVGQGSLALGDASNANAKLTDSSKKELIDALTQNHTNLVSGDRDASQIDSILGADFKPDFEYTDHIYYAGEDIDGNPITIRATKNKGDYATAIGHLVVTDADRSVAVGNTSYVGGDRSIGLGANTLIQEKASDSIGIGSGVMLTAANTLGIGTGVSVTKENAMAIGYNAVARAKKSQAIGNGAIADLENSTAIGVNSMTDYNDHDIMQAPYLPKGTFSMAPIENVGVISVGSAGKERRIVNLAGGYRDTDAVNVGQLRALENRIDGSTGPDLDLTKQRYVSVQLSDQTFDLLAREPRYRKLALLEAKRLRIEAVIKKGGDVDQKVFQQLKDKIATLKGELGTVGGDAQAILTKLENLEVTGDLVVMDKAISELRDQAESVEVYSDADLKKLQKSNALNNQAIGKASIAIGHYAHAGQAASLTIGQNARSSAVGGIAIGTNADAAGGNRNDALSLAIGYRAKAYGSNVSLGSFSATDEYGDYAVGSQGVKQVKYGQVAVGTGATTIGPEGNGNNGNGNIAIGSVSQSLAGNSIAIGALATILRGGDQAVAIGNSSSARGQRSIVIGENASSGYSTSTGNNGVTNSNESVVIGSKAHALNYSGISIGSGAIAGSYDSETIKALNTKKGELDAALTQSQQEYDAALENYNKVAEDGNAKANQDEIIEYYTAMGEKSIALDKVKQELNAVTKDLALAEKYSVSKQADNGQDTIAIGRQSKAIMQGSVALGYNATVQSKDDSHRNGVAIGNGANVSGASSIAIGNSATSAGNNAFAAGISATASGVNSVAIGKGANASGKVGVTIGDGSSVTASGGVAIGASSIADREVMKNVTTSEDATVADNKVFAFGSKNDTSVADTVVGSRGAVSVGRHKGNDHKTRQIIHVAAGSEDTDAVNVAQLKSVANAMNTYFHVNTGDTNQAAGDATTNLGSIASKAGATGTNAISGGMNALAAADKSIVFGQGATAITKSQSSIVIGEGAKASFHDDDRSTAAESIIIGKNAAAGSYADQGHVHDAIAIGTDSKGYGHRAVTIGKNAHIGYSDSVAIGANTYVMGAGSMALGKNASVEKQVAAGEDRSLKKIEHGLAIGEDSHVYATGGVALGYNSVSDHAAVAKSVYLAEKEGVTETVLGNLASVSVGNDKQTRQITNLAAGALDTDAVNVAQLKAAMKDAGGELAYKASQTDGTQRGEGQSVAVGTGLDFTDGTYTTATVAANGKVTFDVSDDAKAKFEEKAKITAGDNVNVTGDGSQASPYVVSAVGTGTVTNGNSNLITGDTLFDEVRVPVSGDYNYIAAGNTAGENIIALDKKVGDNAANITKVENIANGAIQDIASKDKTVMVTEDDKGNVDLAVNIDNATVVKDKNTGVISVGKIGGTNIEDNAITGDHIADGTINEGDINAELVKEFKEKAHLKDGKYTTVEGSGSKTDPYKVNVTVNGSVADGNTGLVTGDVIFDEVRVGDAPADSPYNVIAKDNTAGENIIALDKKVGDNAANITNVKHIAESAVQTLTSDDGTVKLDRTNNDFDLAVHIDGKTIKKETTEGDTKGQLSVDAQVVGDTYFNDDNNVNKLEGKADIAYKANGGKQESVKLNKGFTFKEVQDETKVTADSEGNITFGLADDIKDKLKELDFTVKYDNDGTTTDKSVVTLGGTGGTTVKNVKSSIEGQTGDNFVAKLAEANKTNSKDAVNVSDLHNLGEMKANTDLSNITNEGNKVITELAQKSIDVKGTGKATVTDAMVDGVKTFTVNVAADGKVKPGDSNIVSGDTVYNALQEVDLAYKANGKNGQTVKLTEGLNFVDGKNTTATVDKQGKVVIDIADAKIIDAADETFLKIDGSNVGGEDGKAELGKNVGVTAITDKVGDQTKLVQVQAVKNYVDGVENTINNTIANQEIMIGNNGQAKTGIKLSDGLNFKNGTYTVAKTDANGNVSFDIAADKAAKFEEVSRETVTNNDEYITVAGNPNATDVNNKEFKVGLNITALEKDLDKKYIQHWTANVNGNKVKDIGNEDVLNFKNGTNIEITQDENKNVVVSTSMTPSFTTVTTGNTVMGDKGLTINNPTSGGKPIVINNGKIDLGGNKIQNIAKGTDGSDAVNLDQLNEKIANVIKDIDGDIENITKIEGDHPVMYTDKDGNKVIEKDNKYYTADAFVSEGVLKPDAKEVTDVQANVVNAHGGSTKTPIIFGNVASSIESAVKAAGKDVSTPEKLNAAKLAALRGDVELNGTDVVNISDLKTLANAGLTFVGNDGNEVAKKLGETLTLKGEGVESTTPNTFNSASGNINVKKDEAGTGLEIQLAKDLTNMDSISHKEGAKITLGDTNISLGDKDGNAITISNVKAGENPTDAVNKKQLDDLTIAFKDESGNSGSVKLTDGFTFANGTNTVATVDKDGKVTYDVSADADAKYSAKSREVVVAGTDNEAITVTPSSANAKDDNRTFTVSLDKAKTIDLLDETFLKIDGTNVGGDTGKATFGSNVGVTAITDKPADQTKLVQVQAVKNYVGDQITNNNNNFVMKKTFGITAEDKNAVTKTLDNTVKVIGDKQAIETKVVNGEVVVALKDNIVIGGEKGEAGKPGKAGAIGIDGENGIIGLNGKDGKDGITINGKDGTIGINGQAGIDGKPGADAKITVVTGTPGVDGKPGVDGLTRIIYEDKGGNHHEVATLGDGLKFSGNDKKVVTRALNTELKLQGEGTDLTNFKSAAGNIAITQNAAKDGLDVKLNKDLQGIASIGNGNNGAKIILGDTDKNISVNGGKITNVAKGDVTAASKDAINGSQLHPVIEDIKTINTTIGKIGTVETAEGSGLSISSTNKDLKNGNITIDLDKKVIGDLVQGTFEAGTNMELDKTTKPGTTIVKTAAAVAFDKVTVGEVVVDKDTGIDAGNKVISNVKSSIKDVSSTEPLPNFRDKLAKAQQDTNLAKNAVNVSDLQALANESADKNLSNITEAGNTVIKKLAKSAINMENGTNTVVSAREVDGVKTFKVDVAANGTVANGDSGLISGGTLFNEVRVPTLTGGDKYNVIAAGKTAAENLVALDEEVGTKISAADISDIEVGGIATISPNKNVAKGKVTISVSKDDVKKAAQESLTAGDNIELTKDAKGNTTIATKKEVAFDKVTVGTDADKKIVLNKAGNITVGDKTTIANGKASFDTAIIGKQSVANGKGDTETGNYVTGLDNKTWNKDNIVSGRAATEDQLKEVASNITTEVGTVVAAKQFGLTDKAGTNKVMKALDGAIKVVGDDNITTTANATDGQLEISLNNKLTLGTGADQVVIDGTAGKGSISLGDKDDADQFTSINNGDATFGGAKIGHHNKLQLIGAGGNPTGVKEEGNFVTGLDNKTWDEAHGYVSGRAATEDQLKVVDGKIAKIASEGLKVTNGKNIAAITVDKDGQSVIKTKEEVQFNTSVTVGTKSVITDGNATFDAVNVGQQKANITAMDGTPLMDETTGIQKQESGNFVTGLGNKTWDPAHQGYASGRAATEDQLFNAVGTGMVNFYNGGSKDANGKYTAGSTNFDVTLKDLTFDFGDGLKVEEVTKDGKEVALITLDKEALKGDPDFKGDKGDQGDAGAVGPQGPAGKPGKDGVDGKDGIGGGSAANVEAGTNVTVEPSTDADGNPTQKVSVEGDLNQITSISNTTTTEGEDGEEAKTEGAKISLNNTDKNISVNDGKITNVAPGTDPTDAVNVSQLNNFKAEVGNTFNQFSNRINNIDKRARAGIAAAGAMATLPQEYRAGRSQFAMASTYYRGESAMAVGFSRVSDNSKWIIRFTGSTNSQKDTMVGAGFGYSW